MVAGIDDDDDNDGDDDDNNPDGVNRHMYWVLKTSNLRCRESLPIDRKEATREMCSSCIDISSALFERR